MRFSKKYVEAARREFTAVFVEKVDRDFAAHPAKNYRGNQLRIYVSGWNVEEEIIFDSNTMFKRWFRKYMRDIYEVENWRPSMA